MFYINCMLKQYFGYTELNNWVIKINFTCFFSLFKMWTLEEFKLHIWLALYFFWT